MPPIRVLVVEDSVTVRRHLIEALAADPELQVVGQAGDGKCAIELCQTLHPDVVTVDMALPILSGVAVTEYIMAYCPTPILIVSSSMNRGNLYQTYDALAAGAVDVLEKPKGDEKGDAWEKGFVSQVKLVSRVRVVTHIRGRLEGCKAVRGAEPEPRGVYRAVGIGASTGGPAAVLELLRNLGVDFPLPILLVIHIGESFCESLVSWLDSHSPLRVSCARDGEPLPEIGRGRVLMPASGRHLVLAAGCLRLSDAPARQSCRPSADVLFESLARELGPSSIACLLTGMGKDGAAGLLTVRRAGGRTLVQDEQTSTVFGMPREAIRLEAAEQVLPLGELAPELLRLVTTANGRRVGEIGR